jgi:hypothetical protein
MHVQRLAQHEQLAERQLLARAVGIPAHAPGRAGSYTVASASVSLTRRGKHGSERPGSAPMSCIWRVNPVGQTVSRPQPLSGCQCRHP